MKGRETVLEELRELGKEEGFGLRNSGGDISAQVGIIVSAIPKGRGR